MKIEPARRVRGHVPSLPGDKSISHRAAIIGALARGRTRIENYSTGEDCAATLRCLLSLGVPVERDAEAVYVGGPGGRLLRAARGPLDCGNSGSTMRMLSGVLAGLPFATTLTGDASLSRRPMRRIIEPLELMGARVAAEQGHAPLRIEGREPLAPIEYVMPVASAQVKSCVLLAGLAAAGRTRVVEAHAPTRDHTERMLEWFGAPVHVEPGGAGSDGGTETARAVAVDGPAAFDARDVTVPGDISSAAFLVAAAALLPGSELLIEGVGLNPTRAAFVHVLSALGADVRVENPREQCNEPVGDLRVRGVAGLAPPGGAGTTTLGGAVVANLIDELPVLAVVATRVAGGLEIRGARELRVKESDRIGATVENLRLLGAEVDEFEDGMAVRGPASLRGARLDARGDHRIAMACAVAALLAEGETEVVGAEECVAVSFPEFFPLLESLAER